MPDIANEPGATSADEQVGLGASGARSSGSVRAGDRPFVSLDDDDTLFRPTQRIPRPSFDDVAGWPANSSSGDRQAAIMPTGATRAPRPVAAHAGRALGAGRALAGRALGAGLGVAAVSLALVAAGPLAYRPPGFAGTGTFTAASTRSLPTLPVGATVTVPLPSAVAPEPVRPRPQAPVQPVSTLTQVVVVTVAVTPSPAPSSPISVTPSAFPLATWAFTLDGLGPIGLGMPVADAVAAGYVVADPASPSGYLTASTLGDGVRVDVADGVVSTITITDPAVVSGQGVRVGSALTDLPAAYGSQLVDLPAVDAAGAAFSLPGLESTHAYVAFVPAGSAVGHVQVGLRRQGPLVLPSPSASPTGTPTAPATPASPSPTPSPTPPTTP